MHQAYSLTSSRVFLKWQELLKIQVNNNQALIEGQKYLAHSANEPSNKNKLYLWHIEQDNLWTKYTWLFAKYILTRLSLSYNNFQMRHATLQAFQDGLYTFFCSSEYHLSVLRLCPQAVVLCLLQLLALSFCLFEISVEHISAPATLAGSSLFSKDALGPRLLQKQKREQKHGTELWQEDGKGGVA